MKVVLLVFLIFPNFCRIGGSYSESPLHVSSTTWPLLFSHAVFVMTLSPE